MRLEQGVPCFGAGLDLLGEAGVASRRADSKYQRAGRCRGGDRLWMKVEEMGWEMA